MDNNDNIESKHYSNHQEHELDFHVTSLSRMEYTRSCPNDDEDLINYYMTIELANHQQQQQFQQTEEQQQSHPCYRFCPNDDKLINSYITPELANYQQQQFQQTKEQQHDQSFYRFCPNDKKLINSYMAQELASHDQQKQFQQTEEQQQDHSFYRFCPSDEELIISYMAQELANHDQQQQQFQQKGEQQQGQQQLLDLHEASTSRMEYPPGYRFCPSDEELIISYLAPKLANNLLPFNEIPIIDITQHSPESMKEMYNWSSVFKEDEMYFFTSRMRKYAKGTRPNRTAASGYWKPTGTEKRITNGGKIIGYKKLLDFFTGTQNNGKKTSWKMQEYRIDRTGTPPNKTIDGQMNMQLDRYVLCKIYLSNRKRKMRDDDTNYEEEGLRTPSDDTSGQTGNVHENDAFIQYQNGNLVGSECGSTGHHIMAFTPGFSGSDYICN